MFPDKILENLSRNETLTEEQVPLKKDLYNFLQTLRNKVNGQPHMHLGELASWCLDHNLLPEESLMDQPFVVDYNVFFPDDEERRGDFEHGDIFRFFITTRRLIQFSLKGKVILHTDATYKINWNGYPLLVVGTSDLNRAFHPLGLALCSRETHLDYKFLFNSLLLGQQQMNITPSGDPISLMADAAGAITNGFAESGFALNKRGMCWFHAKSAIDKKVN